MKVAIIGSGIAGLSSAYFLREHDCEVFEAKPYLGLAGHGYELEDGNMIDIPLRVIHPEYYPHLFSLCKELKVNFRKVDHSGTFSLTSSKGGFEYFGIPLFKRSFKFLNFNLKHLGHGVEFMRFYFLCHKFKNDPEYELISFKEFLARHKISKKLSRLILYPLLSTICTCSYDELDCYPSRLLIEMVSVIAGPVPIERFYSGTLEIEKALIKDLNKIRLSSKVQNIRVLDDGVELLINGEIKKFDHLVLATEAHYIKNFLEENEHTKDVLKDLNKIPYVSSDTIIHTVDNNDKLVKRQRALHYLEHPNGGQAQTSMWINRMEPHLKLKHQTVQTWNPHGTVKNELKRTTLNRALLTIESYQAVKRLRKLQHPAFSLAGSYLARGVPLLEGGVASAKHVDKMINNFLKV